MGGGGCFDRPRPPQVSPLQVSPPEPFLQQGETCKPARFGIKREGGGVRGVGEN